MAYNHTLQERYSALVDAKLRYNLIKRNGAIFNTRYEGNPKAGAVKIPVRDTEVIAAAYDATSGAQLTAGATNYLTVNINKDYAVNELIDNYEAAAVPDNLVADRLDSAAYSLALQMEQDATAELESGSTPSSGITAVAAPKVNGAVRPLIVTSALSEIASFTVPTILTTAIALVAAAAVSSQALESSGHSLLLPAVLASGQLVEHGSRLDVSSLFIFRQPERAIITQSDVIHEKLFRSGLQIHQIEILVISNQKVVCGLVVCSLADSIAGRKAI